MVTQGVEVVHSYTLCVPRCSIAQDRTALPLAKTPKQGSFDQCHIALFSYTNGPNRQSSVQPSTQKANNSSVQNDIYDILLISFRTDRCSSSTASSGRTKCCFERGKSLSRRKEKPTHYVRHSPHSLLPQLIPPPPPLLVIVESDQVGRQRPATALRGSRWTCLTTTVLRDTVLRTPPSRHQPKSAIAKIKHYR